MNPRVNQPTTVHDLLIDLSMRFRREGLRVPSQISIDTKAYLHLCWEMGLHDATAPVRILNNSPTGRGGWVSATHEERIARDFHQIQSPSKVVVEFGTMGAITVTESTPEAT